MTNCDISKGKYLPETVNGAFCFIKSDPVNLSAKYESILTKLYDWII